MPEKRMQAIVQRVYGGPEVLEFEELAVPEPGPRDLLVRVKAVSVNPVDTKVRTGRSVAPGTPLPDAPKILGWDASGTVVSIGSDVSRFAVGDDVYFAGDVNRPGSYAEFVAVDERLVGRKPASLAHDEAAALPLTVLTAWEGILESILGGQTGNGDILVVGGAGGVGSIAIQVAKRIAGLRVIATASRPESAEFCRQQGADIVIDHSREFAPQLEAAGIKGVPYIFSTATLDNFSQLVACLQPLGRICVILAGPPATALDVSGLFHLRGTLIFEFMFTRSTYGVEPERQGQILDTVADKIDAGILKSTLTESLSWREVQRAHTQSESGRTLGKIALRVDQAGDSG